MIPSLANVIVLPPLIALLVSGSVIALLIRSRAAQFALDHPNQRSLHTTPTSRLGGVGIAAGVATAWLYAAPVIDLQVVLALALLVGVSLVDDMRGMGVAWRFSAHLAAAWLAVSGLLQNHDAWLVAVAVLATAWTINLYNFMDGADGLAGGMALIGFGSYGVAALTGGDSSFAALNFSVAAAALGFLLFNFPPARIFMGDADSIPLGCLAAVMSISGTLRGDWPWWFGLAVFSPFVVDASLTLCRRLLRGAKVWQAHREHFYQRLVQCGWGHRKTACAEYALMLVCSVAALAAMREQTAVQLALLVGMTLLYTGLVVVLECRFLRADPGHAEA